MIYATEITIFKDSINQGWLDLFDRFLSIQEENYALYLYEEQLYLHYNVENLMVINNPYQVLPLINHIMREVYLKFNLTK